MPTSKKPLFASKNVLLHAQGVQVVLGGYQVLDGVDFAIQGGEFVGLIGPNGAGKTTLLRVLLGLVPPTEGIVSSQGVIGYVPQRGSVGGGQVSLNVAEVVGLGVTRAGLGVDEALARVGMAALRDRRYNELSGGQQQRVLIAKALASKPSLLILDEPTTGIDRVSEQQFYGILEEMRGQGIAILMVSHDIEAVVSQVDRVVCLNRRILYDGSPQHFEVEAHIPRLYGVSHQVLMHHHADGYEHPEDAKHV